MRNTQMAMLINYFKRLPERRPGESSASWAVRLQEGMGSYHEEVSSRYTEGTLQRMLGNSFNEARRAAVVALSLVGTMDSNKLLAARLHDADAVVRQLAHDGLWSIWFRADTRENNQELQRLTRLRDSKQAFQGFEKLLHKAPGFAEAFNQRAILYYRMEEYSKSIADCETVLRLNSHHFGAASGMGQCYMKMRKPRAALKALRHAHRINPNIDGLRDTIRTLEEVLGEEGKKE